MDNNDVSGASQLLRPSQSVATTRRVLYPVDSSESKFCSNRVSTSKYTLWNFIPKFLGEQFSKVLIPSTALHQHPHR